MSFNSPVFLFLFFPIFLIIYLIVPRKCKKYVLLLGNILFYIYGGIQSFLILFFSIITNYLFGFIIQRTEKFKKIYLIMGICSNILILSFFKYFNYFLSSITMLLKGEGITASVIMPLGISFFTFQGISYIVDIYRGKIKSSVNIVNFALYISFFPTILSGPILRYDNFENSLNTLDISLNNITNGFKRFVLGISKKVLLADSLGILVDSIWILDASDLTALIALLGGISYALQIYFDFSGYSDMAIGLGKILGFDVSENFNYPYATTSITKFWRFWNITLSNWFRDYIYIPLGGNKKNQLFNIFMVFLVTGLWHGIGATFIMWAMINCIFNMLEKIFKKNTRKNNIWINIIKHIYVLFIVIISFIFFRSESIDQAFSFLGAIFFNNQSCNPGFNITWFLTKYNILLLIISAISITPLWKHLYNKVSKKISANYMLMLENIVCLILMFTSLMAVVSSNYNSFIYFQF